VEFPPEKRTPVAIAAMWSSRITTVSLEMVLPGLLGLWIDSKLGTKLLFGLVGFAFGMVAGIRHLITMTNSSSNKDVSSQPDGQPRKSDR
jgi:F0F1-type ATP synthase assembly protein I